MSTLMTSGTIAGDSNRAWLVALLCLMVIEITCPRSTEGRSDVEQNWLDTFYQYRLPVTVSVEAAGWHVIPMRPEDIVASINVIEGLDYDPTWFAYNHLVVTEQDEVATGKVVQAGFYLILDDNELIDPSVVGGTEDQVNIPVEPGSAYLLRYTASGAGRSPALEFTAVFPVMHTLRRYAYQTSYEPRMLPMARTEREVLLKPNTSRMPLHVGGRFVRGLEEISLKKARIVFLAHFDSPGVKELMLYYQPLTGHFLTVPEKRRDGLPQQVAELQHLRPAEKYLGQTAYRLSGVDGLNAWVAETTVKFAPDSPAPESVSDVIRIACAANEAQSLQLILRAREEVTLQGFDAEDLRGDNGGIPSDRVSIKRIEYVPITEPSFLSPISYRGPLADPLTQVKTEQITPVDGNVGYWITISVPPGTPKGIYRGAVSIRCDGRQDIEVPIELEVFGFELPEFSPFRSSMGGVHISKSVFEEEKNVAEYHSVSSREDMRRLARGYYDVMVRHKFTPLTVLSHTPIGLKWSPPPEGFNVDKEGNFIELYDWDFTELNKDMQHYADDLKVNAFALVHTNPSRMTSFDHLPGEAVDSYIRTPPMLSQEWQIWRRITRVGYDKLPEDDYVEVTKDQFDDVVLKFYRAFAENLDRHGWLDHAYIFVDEGYKRGQEPLIHMMELLKSDPLTARIKFVWCIQSPVAFNHKRDPEDTGYAYNGLLDIYVPETNENHNFWERHYFEDYGIEFTRENLWNYMTYTTRVAIDTPGINNRIIAPQVFHNGGGGFAVWASFVWDSQRHQESNHSNPWEQPWTRWGNGAMSYFYPPHREGLVESAEPDFTITPSLRVETYRESVDDYEYAWLLERLIQQQRAAGVEVSAQESLLQELDRFFVSPVHWSQNDAWYLAWRERVARAIEELNR